MAHPIDLHVGTHLRIIRKMKGLSQSELAQEVGLTFQQVQKYERGTNRISASKLFEFSKALKINVHDFFAGLDDGVEKSPLSKETPISDEALSLVASFESIPDAAARKQISQLVSVLSGDSTKEVA